MDIHDRAHRTADKAIIRSYIIARKRMAENGYPIKNEILSQYLDVMRNVSREMPGLGCMIITIGQMPVKRNIMQAITDNLPATAIVRVTGQKWDNV
jgi:hypothetical protein